MVLETLLVRGLARATVVLGHLDINNINNINTKNDITMTLSCQALEMVEELPV